MRISSSETSALIWLYVALGGAGGSLLRFGIGRAVQQWWPSPAGVLSASAATLTVNLVGSFCIGAFLAWSSRREAVSPFLPAFFAVGLLGGFTTFSAFSKEALEMALAGRVIAAFAYTAASVALSLLAVFAGYFLVR